MSLELISVFPRRISDVAKGGVKIIPPWAACLSASESLKMVSGYVISNEVYIRAATAEGKPAFFALASSWTMFALVF